MAGTAYNYILEYYSIHRCKGEEWYHPSPRLMVVSYRGLAGRYTHHRWSRSHRSRGAWIL